jgi:hypothetical protein
MSDEGSLRKSVQCGDGKEGIADARKGAKEKRERLEEKCKCVWSAKGKSMRRRAQEAEWNKGSARKRECGRECKENDARRGARKKEIIQRKGQRQKGRDE